MVVSSARNVGRSYGMVGRITIYGGGLNRLRHYRPSSSSNYAPSGMRYATLLHPAALVTHLSRRDPWVRLRGVADGPVQKGDSGGQPGPS